MTARLAPIPDSIRCTPSSGALRLQALRLRADFFDTCPFPDQLTRFKREYGDVSFDAMAYQLHQQLREQGAYLIAAGVR